MSNNPGLSILFEDNHIIVAVKPAGIPSQKNLKDKFSFYDYIKEHTKNGFTGLVHRLDKSVTGVMVVAKTKFAASVLSKTIKEGLMEKIYLAVVEGKLNGSQGILKHFHEKKNHRAHIFSIEKPGTKPAILHWEKIDEMPDRTLLKINLKTGRYNQIRSQFAYIKHPVLGDYKYSKKSKTSDFIALLCLEISFPHPLTGKIMKFSLPSLPDYWSYFWNKV